MANIDLKNPAVQKILLSAVASCGVLGVFFFTHLVPFGYPNRQEQIVALKAEHEKKSTELARARATVADLPRFEAEYEQLHARWELAAELLPADRQMPALLRKITLAGQQSGVEFVTFRPNGIKPQDHYTELPLQLHVQGGYHQVGSFLAELANMRRIVTVSNLSLKTYPQGDQYKTTAAEFNASAYSLNAGPSNAGKPSAGGNAAPAGAGATTTTTAPLKEADHARKPS